MKLTADTITDDQLSELRGEYVCRPDPEGVYHDCQIALGIDPIKLIPGARRRARARCAEILNDRGAK